MARSVTAATDRLVNTSLNPGSTGALFIRFKPNWNHNDGVAHTLWQFGPFSLTFTKPIRQLDCVGVGDNANARY
jgi:hypothetical protein